MGIKKRGVSPVVSTVLLIMIVIIIAIIILVWALGFIKEAVTKTIGEEKKNAERWCLDVEITTSVSTDGSIITISNTGNIPVYAFNLKTSGSGKSKVKKITPELNGTISPGFSKSVDIVNSELNLEVYDTYDKVKLIPILLGKKEKSSGNEEFPCPETYAQEV